MCHSEQAWEAKFLREYVPGFLAEAWHGQNLLQRFSQCVSELSSRLSGLLAEGSPRLVISHTYQFDQQVRAFVSGFLHKINQDLAKITSMGKRMQSTTSELRQLHSLLQPQAKGEESQIQNLEGTHKYYCQQYSQAQATKITAPLRRHISGHPQSQEHEAQAESQSSSWREKISLTEESLRQAREKHNSLNHRYCTEARGSIGRVMGVLKQTGFLLRQLGPRLSSSNSTKIIGQHQLESIELAQEQEREDSADRRIMQIIEEGERVCLRHAHPIMSPSKARQILEAAILARSLRLEPAPSNQSCS